MNRKVLGGVAALVVVAAAVWFFFLRGKSADAPAAPTTKAAEAPKPSAPKKPGEPDRAAEARALLPRWSPDPDQEGPLRLEGQVVDADGHGIGGAEIWLNSNPPRSTKSEEDGGFSFDKLVGRQYALTATRGDLVGGPLSYRLTDKSDPVVMHLTAGGALSVTVLDDHKQPLKGVDVSAADISERKQQTDELGKVKLRPLRPGYQLVTARAAGYATNTAIAIAGPSGSAPDVTITLKKGASVSGRVVDEAGKPIAKVHVEITEVFDFGGRGAQDDVQTNDKGEFTIAAVAAGKHSVHAADTDHVPTTSETFAVADSAVTGIEIKMAAGGVLAGTVVSSDGKPVGYATVRLTASGGRFGESFRQTTTNGNGAFELRGLARTKSQVRAESAAASSKIVEADLAAKPAITDFKLVLDVTGQIDGFVVDDTGAPLPEVQVTAMPDALGGATAESFALGGMSTTTTDGAGKFAVHGLAPGPYRLSAARRANGFDFGGGDRGVAAKPGDKDVKIVIAAVGSLLGRVQVEGSSQPPALLTVQVGSSAPTPSGGDGKFEVKDLAPGTYAVKFRSPDFADATKSDVKIEPGKPTDLGTLTMQRGRTLTGKVVDGNGGPVAGASVRVGKMLFSLEGAEDKAAQFEGMAGIRSATSGQDGTFAITGLPKVETNAMASDPSRGQSIAVHVPAGTDDPPAVTLTMKGYGIIAGKVTKQGQPMAGMSVTDSVQGTTGAVTFTQTDASGAFALEHAVEGTHVLQVAKQSMMSMSATSVTVQVTAGKTTTANIDIPVGPVTLAVQVTPQAGATVDSAIIVLVNGGHAFTTGKELWTAFIGGTLKGQTTWGPATPSVTFKELMPGDYTVCGLPIGADTMQRMNDDGDLLKVFCAPAKVAALPAQQTVPLSIGAQVSLPPAGSGSGSGQ